MALQIPRPRTRQIPLLESLWDGVIRVKSILSRLVEAQLNRTANVTQGTLVLMDPRGRGHAQPVSPASTRQAVEVLSVLTA